MATIDQRRDIARTLARRYSVLSQQGLDHLTELLVPQKMAKGVQFVSEGEICKYIYYVDKGLVRQYYTKNGKELTEHIGYEGSMIICIESLFKHEPSKLMAETLEPSLLYAIPYDDFCTLTHTSYEYCAFLMNILKESLIISQVKADTLRFETARERYVRTLHDHPDIIRRTPLHIVASYLQMTPETLSRVRTATSEE